MKKQYTIMTALIAALLVSAVAFILAGPGLRVSRELAGRVLVGGAALGLVLAAIARPAKKTVPETATTARRPATAPRGSCSFDDVAANDSARRSLEELKDYLACPDKYARLGARMPKGVLLYGPPGTGKTLLARALAGEAGVPFYAMSGSDFVEKYVGVGAARVRELFRKSRKAGRCVIFIDEIDAMGKRRDDAVSDERDQTLNALLSEMSGFESADGVVVVAATNRLEALDPALLRPGRFDRQIEVGLPERGARLSILKLHARNKPMDCDVDLEALAAQTVSFSGASLENLLNESAILAASRGAPAIQQADVQRAFLKVVAGEDRTLAGDDAQSRAVALHEAGHALIGHLLMPECRLARVSILPAGRGAAGYSLMIPDERRLSDKKRLESQICVLLAGRAAELMALGEEAVTTGASNDLARAAEIAMAMVSELGMDGEPAVCMKALGMAGQEAQQAGRRLLGRLFDSTMDLLRDHRAALESLAQALMKAEALDGDSATQILSQALSNERQETAEAVPI